MENKTILITGANGGLGTAFVKEVLKQNPKKIYCAARDTSSLEKLKALSSVIEAVELDITNKASIDSLASKIETLDILVNNAGVNSNNRLFGGEVYEVLPGPIETRMTEEFPMPKAKPEEIAAAVVEGIAKKEFEIYPDAFSQMVKQRVQSEPEKLMEEFASSLNA